MSNEEKFVFETPESQPTRPARETRILPFFGAFSIGDDRTVFLSQYRIVTTEMPKGIPFGRETMEKIIAILEADAAAKGGVCKIVPQTPMIATRVQTTAGREISNSAFINRMLSVAEASGFKFKERPKQVPQAPAADQSLPSDNVPF